MVRSADCSWNNHSNRTSHHQLDWNMSNFMKTAMTQYCLANLDTPVICTFVSAASDLQWLEGRKQYRRKLVSEYPNLDTIFFSLWFPECNVMLR